MTLKRPAYLVVDGCPCPYDVAPYVWLVLRQARQTAASIYRGDDPAARPILHRHGKHTQRELANATPAQRAAWGVRGTPNQPGRSMHELRSDGVAKPGPVGRHLDAWEVGIDSGSDTSHDKRAINAAAHHYGLETYHPYPRSSVEGHHWGFARRPRADGRHLSKARVIAVRARLRLAR